jgi:predicted  nucleic acid-binding Zn-ribbon protein
MVSLSSSKTRRLAIKESEALLAKYEQQSDNVKNNREFEAINKEIEMQGLEIKLAEKHIRDANEELADKVKALEMLRKTLLLKKVF